MTTAVLVALAAFAVAALLWTVAHRRRSIETDARRVRWSTPHQGAAEKARRRRQIESGYLTTSNGLRDNGDNAA